MICWWWKKKQSLDERAGYVSIVSKTTKPRYTMKAQKENDIEAPYLGKASANPFAGRHTCWKCASREFKVGL